MKQLHAHEISKTAIFWHVGQDLTQPLDELVNTLRAQQYRTLKLAEPSQVADAILNIKADVLFIDLPTVGPRGYDLCETLREQSTTRHLPIVFVSAYPTRQERIEALRCGGSEYLVLPTSSEECWLSIKPHLEAYQAVRHLQKAHRTLSQQVGQYSHLLARQAQMEASLTEENHALQRLAFVDELTQVGNRRQFDQRIATLWKAAFQQAQPLSLIMCDIDYFKRYNDTYGHLAGDGCLRSVAAALVAGIQRCEALCERPNAVQVMRYGGEEFAILLPNMDKQGAQQAARSIQAAIARANIPHKGSLIKPHVTLSIGIHTLVPATAYQTYDRLIYGADKALYTAKLRGRDRIVTTTLTEKLIATPHIKPLPERIFKLLTPNNMSEATSSESAPFPVRLTEHVA